MISVMGCVWFCWLVGLWVWFAGFGGWFVWVVLCGFYYLVCLFWFRCGVGRGYVDFCCILRRVLLFSGVVCRLGFRGLVIV